MVQELHSSHLWLYTNLFEGAKKTNAQIRTTAIEKSKPEDKPKLVDYADEEEKAHKTASGKPFWAAPNALDGTFHL
jgi:hypothetical protein